MVLKLFYKYFLFDWILVEGFNLLDKFFLLNLLLDGFYL